MYSPTAAEIRRSLTQQEPPQKLQHKQCDKLFITPPCYVTQSEATYANAAWRTSREEKHEGGGAR